MKIMTITIQCEEGPCDVRAIVLYGLAVHPKKPELHTYHRVDSVVYSTRVAITHAASGLKVGAAHTLELAVMMCGRLMKVDWVNKSMEELSESEEVQRVVDQTHWWHCRLMETCQTMGLNVRSEEPITLVDAGGEG